MATCGIRYAYYVKLVLLLIEKDVVMKRGCFWFEDVGNKIIVRKNTTIEEAHFAACENNTEIVLGKDCMLSSGIRIATTDSHSIIKDGNRINYAKSVIIGNHVWIGTRCAINKGVSIGEKSIIAAGSVVICNVPSGELWGGNPAKYIRKIDY